MKLSEIEKYFRNTLNPTVTKKFQFRYYYEIA